MGDDEHQYMNVSESESEATFRRFFHSVELEQLKREYDAPFAAVAERGARGTSRRGAGRRAPKIETSI